jgi:hypothetical protein
LQNNFDLYEFNMIDMDAKKVLVALAEFNKGEFAKGEQSINSTVKVLEKTLIVDNPSGSRRAPPYDFSAVAISEFGRQVLEQFG